jgi:hypothetical protein
MESFMFKKLLAFALLTGSVSGIAQTYDEAGNKTSGTFPEVRAVEQKEDYKLHMGLSGGISVPEGSAGDSPEFGVSVGYQPMIPFGLGAEVATSKLDDGSDDQRTSIFARGTYNFGGDTIVLKNSWVGVLGGPVIVDDNFEWGWAPTLGFDIPLSDKAHDFISLGLNARYMFVTDSPDAFSAAAAVKYWY